MHLIAVSINHRTADVALREKVAFKDDAIRSANVDLYETKSILENVILSTCNRTEVYAVADQIHTGRYYIQRFLARSFGLDVEDIKNMTEVKVGDEAVKHLLQVTSGLDSVVLGETQILGQIRNAFFLAQEEDTTGTIFNHLFKQAITFAKKAHNETDIADNAVSVSYAAVELSKKVFGKVNNKQALIIGAGDMSELSLLNLIGSGVTDITIVNRTLSKAQDLAMKHHVKFEPMESLPRLLVDVDIVISSTSSENYIVTNEMLQSISTERKHDSLVMIDIAVPRDIEPNIDTIHDMFSYDVDDLKGLVDANLRERQLAAEQIIQNIPNEIEAHNEWVNMLGVVPVIRALREKAMSIQEDTMDSIDRKLPGLSERERKIISKHTKSIINQMLKDPIKQAKELSSDKKSNEKLELFQSIFDIEAENAYEAKKQKNNMKTGQILSFE
ncbi:glutamyl-tRNA reductase [Staphylococcus saprophyticus]|uniref:Glutamyl-tRNA reductase n=1 Tax=Staphylococcus saprophyticus subsp. saprophyticus (strain ATCC 15305 / DSM 20229 / NCIMB 8711 / NCTC 7292 / S-41) TaxID=342451 RepID=HEM1_STAS1|nr:glutamyl-tRNA reductase [Staphylococcus saprophyticus]Q49YA4.1 RecName: Full=Glutamyl-tRNA reductase; Short=GluTR [Staphylococcus saprophyticus subsp. saprophyticus ATCC 15305 = NCTC 7292]CRV16360.1 glutamyl-tRNA reductase [Streptococcus equi subsp. equi]ASE59186.1 glutamyl-tRNA reductase [Staphylococcus saprophyticus]ASF17957.1 glutamyl-tRNA reductase [Staphylococcus saprophyticus]MBN6849597.1 glutamyl-tRNA reductase [Staphylococcus saprophyticus]MCM3119122.1 glutamyl-tRNA reductase [Stap